jgi:hypothetical protein
MAAATFVLADSTWWFQYDQEFVMLGGEQWHLGKATAPLSADAPGVTALGRSGERCFAPYLEELPIGSTVLLVGGWNWAGSTGRAEDMSRMELVARERQLLVARCDLYEASDSDEWSSWKSWYLEKEARELMPSWPSWRGFAGIYRDLAPMKYNWRDQDGRGVLFEDTNHRVWTDQVRRHVLESLLSMVSKA